MSPPARTHCQLVRLAFRAVAPGGGPVRRRLSCPGRSRLATLQLRRRGGRAERRGQVEEGSGAFPRGHAAGGQGTRGQQGWPQGGGPWARGTMSAFVVPLGSLPEPDWGAEGPRERTFAAQVRPFPRRRCSCQCSEAQRGAAPESPEPSAPPPRAAEPVRGAASHARPRATRTAFPGREACRPRPRWPGRRAAGGRRGGQPRCWAGGSGSGRARPTRRCKAGASECRARAARPAASLSAVTPMRK